MDAEGVKHDVAIYNTLIEVYDLNYLDSESCLSLRCLVFLRFLGVDVKYPENLPADVFQCLL